MKRPIFGIILLFIGIWIAMTNAAVGYELIMGNPTDIYKEMRFTFPLALSMAAGYFIGWLYHNEE